MVSRLAAELCPSPNGPSKSRLFKLAIVGRDLDAASDFDDGWRQRSLRHRSGDGCGGVWQADDARKGTSPWPRQKRWAAGS